MNRDLKALLETEATDRGVSITSDLELRLDRYISHHFSTAPEKDKIVIETYLSQAALRIAIAEGKRVVEGEDLKAAIWLFHQPEGPDDPCAVAGHTALQLESKRPGQAGRQQYVVGSTEPGILLESFAKYINKKTNKGTYLE